MIIRQRGVCEHTEDYKYSSARFYILNEKDWYRFSYYNG
jgi:hypothetical protein